MEIVDQRTLAKDRWQERRLYHCKDPLDTGCAVYSGRRSSVGRLPAKRPSSSARGCGWGIEITDNRPGSVAPTRMALRYRSGLEARNRSKHGGLRHPRFPHAGNFPMKSIDYKGKIGEFESRTECQNYPYPIEIIEVRGGIRGPLNPASPVRVALHSPTASRPIHHPETKGDRHVR